MQPKKGDSLAEKTDSTVYFSTYSRHIFQKISLTQRFYWKD
jgi:hypothetical protein